VRYLVINHQIPVYRIYELGLGNAKMQAASEEQTAKPVHGNRVQVTLLRIASRPAEYTAGAFDVSASVVHNRSKYAKGAGQTGLRLLLCLRHYRKW